MANEVQSWRKIKFHSKSCGQLCKTPADCHPDQGLQPASRDLLSR